MPPAKGQKRSKKPVSAELVAYARVSHICFLCSLLSSSDVELPAQPVPAPPKITSPTRKGRKSGAVELDPDLEVGPVYAHLSSSPLYLTLYSTISPTKLAPHKRKAGRPSTVVDIDDDSSYVYLLLLIFIFYNMICQPGCAAFSLYQKTTCCHPIS